MKNLFTLLIITFFSIGAKAQKVDSIYFNLYTDSLKKGVYNYISVDGKLSTGNFQPLMTDEVTFSSNGGRWDGNSIIIDSAYKEPSVIITAKLKSNPSVSKSVTIFIKTFDKPERLKTEQEVIDGIRNSGRRRNLTS